MLVFVVISA